MSKLDEATNKARNRDRNRGEANSETAIARTDDAPAHALATNFGSLVADPSGIAERLKAGAWEAAPQILTMEEGKTYVGFLEAHVKEGAEVKDPRTGEVKLVDTWILRSLDGSGLRVSILTSAQLDKKLPHFLHGEVSITRLATFRTNSGGQCTEYVVAGPKRADGKARDWAGIPTASGEAQ